MKFLYLFIALLVTTIKAQDVAAFNSIYTKTFLETSQKDFTKALQIADSLYTISGTPVLQTKSLMLSATLYQQSGDFERALDYASRAEKIINTTDNVIWKAKIYGFMASHYRYIRLFDQSKKYYELGLSVSKEITNPDLANNTMAMMMQEKAYYDIEKKDYKNSILSIIKSAEYVANTTANKSRLVINNEQLLGYNYYHLKDYKSSLLHYLKALKLSEDMPEDHLVALIHNGLALVYIQKKDLTKAKEHLDVAMRITEESKNPSLKNEVYETSEKYFALTKNLTDYVKTREKHDTVKRTLQKNMQFLVNKSYSKIDKENMEVKKSNSSKVVVIVILSFLFIIGGLLFLRYKRMQKLKFEHFKQIIKNLDKKKELLSQKETTGSKDKTVNADKPMMSNEKESKILTLLQKFEDSELYTDNSISLSYLATYCETNGKYLSYIINTYKNNDFNNYINTLRINYIIRKLKSSPKYRKYKIAALAEESGFSSLSKFSLVFKQITSIPPSQFIKYLEE